MTDHERMEELLSKARQRILVCAAPAAASAMLTLLTAIEHMYAMMVLREEVFPLERSGP